MSYAKIGSGTIYINDNLKGDLRTHILLRSLLYELGCKGESLNYPDSMFYYDDNTNIRLSLIDKKAVQIMYGARPVPGDDGRGCEECREREDVLDESDPFFLFFFSSENL